ncbi:MAG TPA: FKBP-type peptidyl-prolyl cis-trans isomerase [Xanthomonadaceae bacterium]|nr:FKBP-type peptidyl-prolyl cis-trans isomerase [Xanthomonadaceae bacterium]
MNFLQKSALAVATAAALSVTPFAGAQELTTEKQKISYVVGMQVGNGLGQIKDEIELEVVFSAIRDQFAGNEPRLSEEEAIAVQQAFAQRLQAKRAEEMAAAAQKNKADGEAFLAQNSKTSGVKVTDSGLQYQVIKQGSGPKPAVTDTVKVHYVGTLLDGTKFDSSVDRGQPAQFALNAVIPGWTEALQLMPVGSKYKLWIPSELAYGDRGTPGPIGPNQTLSFEVELLEIVQQ